MRSSFVIKLKNCKQCRNKFEPQRPKQFTCSTECASVYAKAKANKEALKVARMAKKHFRDNDKSILKDRAQDEVNKFIRLRDEGLPCISCGYQGSERQWQAGHYMPKGSNGAIRYNEDNIHKQCSICNNHLSGNLGKYRPNLIKKIGLEKVEWLESQKAPKKWTVEELKEIINTYRQKAKELA